MKKFKRLLSILLVASMLFTTNAVSVFAEGVNDTKASEELVETSEELVGDETEENVGAKLGEPEEETEVETEEETTVGASTASPEEETAVGAKIGEPEEETETQETLAEEPEEETTVGASTASPEEEAETQETLAEEPEEETIVGAKLGEPETEVKTESEAETKVEEKLFGDPPIYTLSLKPNFPEGFSLPEGSSWYEDKSGPLDSDTDSIIIDGWNTRICVDTAGNVCNLTGYNTKADGSGTRFSYQESIFKENLEYFDLPSGSYDLVLYAMWRTSKLYTIHYNQNLPEGYSLAEGSTWGSDATLWDYEDEFEFEIYDYTGMTCEDSDGKTLALIKWNTAADGTGDDQSFGDWITSESFFTDGELTLYAVWGKEYTISYNQNLPEGYNLSEGKTWYADETFPNAESIYTELNGSEDMTCEDANGITRKLLKWNTKADGTGTDYNFAAEIADATHFTDNKLILYAVWSKVYTLSYNQNLPEGYNLSEGKIWYADVTFPDAESIYTEVEGWEDMTCEDATGITRKLLKWNTKADGAGTEYNFADEIADATHFTDYKLILYAVWEPVAPGPTAFAYWKIDGDDANKTIHYYATAGEGRTAVDFDENGVVYTSLSEGERNSIKNAVFEEPIVATDVRKLFSYFKGLVSITNLGNLNTSNATSFKAMFEHCEAIEKIETSGLETDSLTDTSYMFTYCTSATEIILDDNFDTSNVTSMREMFNTTGAKELDLTKFDTSNVTDMYGMFSSCENLETIRVSDKFVVDKVPDNLGKFMFSNCEKLVGEKGTTYADASSPYDKTYAHIDEGTTNPGFFTSAPTPPGPTPGKTISSFVVKTQPSKTTYNSGEAFDPTGLVIRVTYDDSTTADIDYASYQSDFSFNPTIIRSSGNVTITYGGKTSTVAVKVNSSPTPPRPTPSSDSGSSSGGGGASDPTRGPMGDLTKNPAYAYLVNTTSNNIPQSKLLHNDALANTLLSYPENANSQYMNARDENGNVGYGRWLRVPNTTTWYFLSGSFNLGTGTTNTGFIANGWFNLGWDGQDKWYYFDSNGVMKIGWYQEGDKIYYLQADFSDNWYGKRVTGQHVIDGKVYNFDSNGVLIS